MKCSDLHKHVMYTSSPSMAVGVEVGVKCQIFFARNCMKLPCLHIKIMFVTATHQMGFGGINFPTNVLLLGIE